MTLHGIHCIQSGCFGPCWIISTAVNRDTLGFAAWNTLHSMTLHVIHCINWDAFYHAAWNPLHSMTLHGTTASIVTHLPCCMESTAFTRDPFSHAACNALRLIGMHFSMLHGIHCIQCCCMECTTFNRDALGHAA